MRHGIGRLGNDGLCAWAASVAIVALLIACGGGDKGDGRDSGADTSTGVAPSTLDTNLVAHRTLLPKAMVSGKAMSGFVGYVLTIPKSGANSQCGLSATALSGAELSIRPYVPSDAISTIPLGDILYQSVVDKMTAANVGYVAATVSVSDSQVAEVIVEDAFAQQVDPDKVDYAALTALEQGRDTSRVCGLYFVNRAILTTVKSRMYNRGEGQGQIAFALTVGGKHYVSTTNFTSATKLAIDARPLSTLVRSVVAATPAGVDTVAQPVPVTTARAILTAPNIPDTARARLPAMVNVPVGWYEKQRIRVVRDHRK